MPAAARRAPRAIFSSIKRLPLTTLATIFVVLVCCILIAVDGWRTWKTRTQILHDAHISATNLTRALSQYTEDAIYQADVDLLGLVGRIEAEGMHPDELAQIDSLLKKRAKELPDLHRILIVDEAGHKIAATIDTHLPNLNFSDREYFRFHRDHADPGPHIGQTLQSRSTGEWILPISRRISHADGSFAGVALAVLTLNAFQNFYNSFDIGRAGSITVLLDNGSILAHRPFNPATLGKNIAHSALFRDHIATTRNGSAIGYSSIDGIERLHAYQHLTRFPIVILAALSQKEILAMWLDDTIQHSLNIAILVFIIGLLGLLFVRQINKLSQAKEAVAASEKHLRLITDNLPMAVAYIDAGGKVLFSNKIFTAYLNRPLSAILGQTFESLLGNHYEDRIPHVKTVLSGRTAQFERSELYQGKLYHLNIAYIPDRDAQGKVQGFYGVSTDITARKTAEIALQASEFRWKFALEGAGEGVWDWHNHTGEVAYSKRWKEMLGYGEQDIDGTAVQWERLVHPDDKERVIADFRNYLRGDFAHFVNEHRMLCKDGRWKWVLIRGTVVSRNADGKAERTIGTICDITERRESAEALQQSHAQLRRLSDHQEHIKEKERIRIARDIHDELGQNLLALKVDVSMLYSRTFGTHPRLSKRVELALQNIDATIISVKSIINDLRPAALTLGLHAAVEWQLKQYERISTIACKLVTSEDGVDAGLTEHQTTAIFRILQESLANIARHAQASAIEVRLSKTDEHFCMQVADNGIGIQPDDRRKMNAFGLIGIKERSHSLGGALSIDSHAGRGTALRIQIPIIPVQVDAMQQASLFAEQE